MSVATSIPVPPDLFATALETMEIAQLHAEETRLNNSIHHLDRSNVALEAEKEDAECKQALEENLETIQRQRDRIQMIWDELKRRGVGKVCGEKEEEKKPNGAPPAAADGNTEGEAGVYL